MKKYLLMSVAAVAVVAAGGIGYYNYYHDNTGITNVFQAAEESAPSKVKKYLRIHKPDLKKSDANGYTLITYAAANKDADMVKAVLDAGAQVNVEAKDGITPLLMAILSQNAEAVKLLLDAGADANFVNMNGWSPLAFAVTHSKNADIVKLLLKRRADTKFKLEGKLGLVNLALQTNAPYDVVEALVKAGANVQEMDKEGNTLIAKAVMLNVNPDVIKLLAENGSDVNQPNLQEMTPLMIALFQSRGAHMVQALIDAGADLTNNPKGILKNAVTKNKDPMVLEVLASANMKMRLDDDDFSLIAETVQIPNQEKMLAKVLEYDNIVNRKNHQGQTPLFAAMIEGQSIGVLDLFKKNGANFNVADNNGQTLLMYAVKNNVNENLLNYLLTQKIDIFAQDKQGRTALDYAAASSFAKNITFLLLDAYVRDGKHQDAVNRAMIQAVMNPDVEVLKKFAEKGGKIDFAKQETPILIIAAGKENMVENVRQMIKLGADAKMQTPEKVTPLHRAAATNPNVDMVKALIEAGADINAQDNNGLTPLMLTVLYNPNGEAVAEVLLEAKANPKLKDINGKTYFDMLKMRKEQQSQMQTEVPENVGEVTPIPEALKDKK